MSATLVVHPATINRAAPPAIRLVPVPRSEPPTDDELAAAGVEAPPMTAPLLPLDLPTGARVQRARGSTRRGRGAQESSAAVNPMHQPEPHDRAPHDRAPHDRAPHDRAPHDRAPHDSAPPDVAKPRRAGGAQGPAGAGAIGPANAPPTTPTTPAEATESTGPSEARMATRRFLATCLEVVGGFRPVAQLRPFCRPDRFDDIADALTGRAEIGPAGRSRGLAYHAARTPVTRRLTGAPPRGGRASQTGPNDRVAVRRVQVCEVMEDVAEIAVVLARRDKVWAMALRFEDRRGRWLCTHLEVL